MLACLIPALGALREPTPMFQWQKDKIEASADMQSGNQNRWETRGPHFLGTDIQEVRLVARVALQSAGQRAGRSQEAGRPVPWRQSWVCVREA